MIGQSADRQEHETLIHLAVTRSLAILPLLAKRVLAAGPIVAGPGDNSN